MNCRGENFFFSASQYEDKFVPVEGMYDWYGAAGHKEKTLKWLEAAYQTRNANMHYIGTSANLRFLHDEPRFQDILKRMNLPLPKDLKD